MRKKSKFLLTLQTLLAILFTCTLLTACGSEEEEEEHFFCEENTYESEDGSKYEYQEGEISLWKDNKRTKKLAISLPPDVEVNIGYGHIVSYTYNVVNMICKYGNHLLLILNANNNGSNIQEVGSWAYLINTDLSSYQSVKIEGGDAIVFCSDLLTVNQEGLFTIYDNKLSVVLHNKINSYWEQDCKLLSFCKAKNNFYLLYVTPYILEDGIAFFLTNLTTSEYSGFGGNVSDVIAAYFPNESPRPQLSASTDIQFNDDHFEILYNIIHYDGAKETIVRKITLDGTDDYTEKINSRKAALLSNITTLQSNISTAMSDAETALSTAKAAKTTAENAYALSQDSSIKAELDVINKRIDELKERIDTLGELTRELEYLCWLVEVDTTPTPSAIKSSEEKFEVYKAQFDALYASK